jgi:hypothetical protein
MGVTVVAVGPFDLIDPTPEDVVIAQTALASVDPTFPLDRLLTIRHRVRFVDSIGALGGKAEGLYPSTGKFQVKRMYNRKGGRRAYREQGTFLHESAHGFHLSRAQKDEIIALFGGTSWGKGPYWDRVNEATCDQMVAIMTGGRIRSHYEDDRLPLRADQVDVLADIVTRLTVPEEPEVEPIPEPTPPVDPQLEQLKAEITALNARLAAKDALIDQARAA